jgi:hypothetical protein
LHAATPRKNGETVNALLAVSAHPNDGVVPAAAVAIYRYEAATVITTTATATAAPTESLALPYHA